MALRTVSPVWLTAILCLGLFLLLLGERALGDMNLLRTVPSLLGVLAVLGSTIFRVVAFKKAPSEHRKVELTFLWCQLGVVVAVIGYFLTTPTGAGLLGIDVANEATFAKFKTAGTILWMIALVVSLTPLLAVEFTLGTSRRMSFDPKAMSKSSGTVEGLRVREVATAGTTVALALSLTMVTCGVAKEKDVQKDYSYFATTRPSDATAAIVKDRSEPIDVYLFFPDGITKQEVENYFSELKRKGAAINVHHKSRVIDAKLAKELSVSSDGAIVFAKGTKNPKRLLIPTDDQKARKKLRELDQLVNKELMKAVRKSLVAYFTVGHGELNTRKLKGFAAAQTMGAANTLKDILRSRNYQVKDLGATQGLASKIPEDAAAVLILGPTIPFSDEETTALGQFIESGGNVIVALDPDSPVRLDSVLQKLGVTFDPLLVLDDKSHVRVNNIAPKAHKMFVLTSSFAAHSSTTVASQSNASMMLVRPGSLTKRDLPANKKLTFVVKSRNTAFADLNSNLMFDADSEKRRVHNFAAAVELKKKDPAKENKFRSMVFADADLFSDNSLGSKSNPRTNVYQRMAQIVVANSILWVGGEEKLAGKIEHEKDIEIIHTKNQNMVWFWANVILVPLLILGLGLLYIAYYKRKTGRQS